MGTWGYRIGLFALAFLGAGQALGAEVSVQVGATFRAAASLEVSGSAPLRFGATENEAPLVRCRMIDDGVERACNSPGVLTMATGGARFRSVQVVYL